MNDNTRKKSILVIDDEKANIITLTHILSEEFTIYAAKNGKDGIELAEQYLPDVILLDIRMPDMDGYKVFSALKASDKTREIPVIFVTALSKAGDEEKGLAMGVADYIIKPFSATVVKLRVRNQIKILEQRMTEENLKKLKTALDQAKKASKAKSVFLSNISHEMRTPLNAIIGLTTIAEKTEDKEHRSQIMQNIGEASAHLLGIINDMLDMAKIETDKLELIPIEYDFERMLQKVIATVKFKADEKRQRLTVNVGGDIPRKLVGDNRRLAQVITNLLSNAIKFTQDEGSICFEVSLIGEDDSICDMLFTVTDNGIGISKDMQEEIFQVFVQADSGSNREYGGTGLGLVISKSIVELMGGRIRVESVPGEGSKFIFTVKAQRGGNSPVPPFGSDVNGEADGVNDKHGCADIPHDCLVSEAGEFAGKRLLLAEDVEINRVIFIELLAETGLVIDCAENGKEALDMVALEPEKYDILFMDMQMPKMDGLEATRRIRALPAHKRERLPIVAMTANVFKDDIEACRSAGMDDHLGKPLDLDAVLKTLRKYI